MRLVEYLQAAGHDLVRHKMRTGLTMLGIIFGVGAVVSMLSIGAGAQQQALETIDAMGLRNIIVRGKQVARQDLYTMRERSLGLSLRELDDLMEVVPALVGSSGKRTVDSVRVLSESGRSEGQVLGVGLQYFDLLNLDVAAGSLFDASEERSFRRVCVLGHRARMDLFAFHDPIGEAVKIGDVWFSVVGVLERQNLAQESFEGVEIESSDNSIFIPVTTSLKMFEREQLDAELDEMILQTAPGTDLGAAAAFTSSVLDSLHGGESDFTIVVPEELLEQSRQTRRIFDVVMGGIAGISLLVGGIGIMNIMLASVLERTREIGIRRAVGATQADIRSQFLTEAVLISSLGGLVGVAFGFSIAWGVALYSSWNTVVTGFSVSLALGFAVAVGLVFGTYPAMNAAKLDPIEALRYE